MRFGLQSECVFGTFLPNVLLHIHCCSRNFVSNAAVFTTWYFHLCDGEVLFGAHAACLKCQKIMVAWTRGGCWRMVGALWCHGLFHWVCVCVAPLVAQGLRGRRWPIELLPTKFAMVAVGYAA